MKINSTKKLIIFKKAITELIGKGLLSAVCVVLFVVLIERKHTNKNTLKKTPKKTAKNTPKYSINML